MDSIGNKSHILHDFSPMFCIYKNGRINRFKVATPIPPSFDPRTDVVSKDIIISKEPSVSVRVFKPNHIRHNQKLPLLIYFHGGGFILESTRSPLYHNYLNTLSSKAQTLIVSVEYRRAPENPLPCAYHDSWNSLHWVNSSREPWIRDHADYSRVFLAGDSSGGNIAHRMALLAGIHGFPGAGDGAIRQIDGVILVHPYFWGKDRIGDEAAKCRRIPIPELGEKIWAIACPGSSGPDDPWINPANDPNLGKLGCERVVIFVAEKDFLRDRGVYYKEVLEKKSGWKGQVEVVETKGEDHVFHLIKPCCKNAVDVMTMVVDFINAPRCRI